jgi:uncharacterized protein
MRSINLSACVNCVFRVLVFDTSAQKYYHAPLMSARAVIDSLEFARAEEELQGRLPAASFERLQDYLVDAEGSVEFVVKGDLDRERRPMLRLEISGMLHLRCQRCLKVLPYALRLSNTLLLVREARQSAVDPDPHVPEFIEASPELDVAALVEDEILLGLPIAPRHEEGGCRGVPGGVHESAEGPSPFAALAPLNMHRDRNN